MRIRTRSYVVDEYCIARLRICKRASRRGAGPDLYSGEVSQSFNLASFACRKSDIAL